MPDNPKFTIKDLKRIQGQNKEQAQISVDLCYHVGKKAYVQPLKVKDKKSLLLAIETEDDKLVQKNFDTILEKYVKFDEGVTHDNITVAERFQILAWIRRAAAGDKVTIAHQCPKCEEVQKDITYSLKDIVVKNYEEDKVGDLSISIANDSVKVYLGPITREEEKNIDEVVFARKIESKTEKRMMYMAGTIQKVEVTEGDITGEVQMDAVEKIEFFEQLSTKDLENIVKLLKKTDHGIVMPFDFKCKNCKYKNDKEEASIAVFFIS